MFDSSKGRATLYLILLISTALTFSSSKLEAKDKYYFVDGKIESNIEEITKNPPYESLKSVPFSVNTDCSTILFDISNLDKSVEQFIMLRTDLYYHLQAVSDTNQITSLDKKKTNDNLSCDSESKHNLIYNYYRESPEIPSNSKYILVHFYSKHNVWGYDVHKLYVTTRSSHTMTELSKNLSIFILSIQGGLVIYAFVFFFLDRKNRFHFSLLAVSMIFFIAYGLSFYDPFLYMIKSPIYFVALSATSLLLVNRNFKIGQRTIDLRKVYIGIIAVIGLGILFMMFTNKWHKIIELNKYLGYAIFLAAAINIFQRKNKLISFGYLGSAVWSLSIHNFIKEYDYFFLGNFFVTGAFFLKELIDLHRSKVRVEVLNSELKEANEGLEIKVKERTSELEKTTIEAVEAKNEVVRKSTNMKAILSSNTENAQAIINADGHIEESSKYFDNQFKNSKDLDSFVRFFEKEHGEGIYGALMSMLGEDEMTFELNGNLLVNKTVINNETYQVQWEPMIVDGIIKKILFTGTNIQKTINQQKEADKYVEFALGVSRMVEIGPKKVCSWMDQTEVLLNAALNLTSNFEKNKDAIFMALHTAKGSSKTLQFNKLGTAIHTAEDALKNNPADLCNKILECKEEFESIRAIAKTLGYSNDIITIERKQLEEAVKSGNLKQFAEVTLYTTFRDFICGHDKEVANIAASLQKPVPRFTVNVPEYRLLEEVRDVLSQSFVHILRNALDHGIESAEERISAKKDPAGTITFIGTEFSEHIRLSIMDDGRGLNLAKIREKAVQKGIISQEECDSMVKNKEHKKIANLIFAQHFSTKDQVSEISGRGVGMETVKKAIESIGGKCEAEVLSDSESTLWQLVIEIPKSYVVK
jgi:HPt (histidine-containing phosphotransfer) domain-containing protein